MKTFNIMAGDTAIYTISANDAGPALDSAAQYEGSDNYALRLASGAPPWRIERLRIFQVLPRSGGPQVVVRATDAASAVKRVGEILGPGMMHEPLARELDAPDAELLTDDELRAWAMHGSNNHWPGTHGDDALAIGATNGELIAIGELARQRAEQMVARGLLAECTKSEPGFRLSEECFLTPDYEPCFCAQCNAARAATGRWMYRMSARGLALAALLDGTWTPETYAWARKPKA